MTRKFNQIYHCQHCGMESDAQTAFSRWMRDNERLDSSNGHVISDFDYVIHRYKTSMYARSIQAIYFLEVKINCAKCSESQAKTLSMAKQFTVNRGLRTLQDGPRGNNTQVWNFGGFELRFSHSSPADSEWIEWNRKKINVETLIKLLQLDFNPITLKKMDWRPNHHSVNRTENLIFEEMGQYNL